MKTKQIDFKTYEQFFYDNIKVNTRSNENNTYHTPIFYRITSYGLIITFEYMTFHIDVVIGSDELKTIYERDNPDEELSDDIKPDPITWVIEKYCDNRGIQTLN